MGSTRRGVDVFVVGGGPAGLAAAIAARRRGLSVTLADGAEPPIDKPCGEGMMPATRAALQELGVELPAGEGCHFRGIQFLADGARVAAAFPQGRGIGIRRPLLHANLVRKAENSGVNFLWRTPIRGIAPTGVETSQGTVTARWIIGADGSGSRVRRWSGLDAAIQRGQRNATRRHYRVRPWTDYMEIYWGECSQAYVTPIAAEEVCIVVMAEAAEDAHFDRALADLPELRERLASAAQIGKERGAITAMYSLRRVVRGNLALVGDASGGVDAITGEGLRLSFRQALTLADAMECGDLRKYERTHRKLARRPMWMGKLLLQLARHAGLRHRVMQAMQQRPKLFERLLAIHVGQATPANVIAAGVHLGWRFLSA